MATPMFRSGRERKPWVPVRVQNRIWPESCTVLFHVGTSTGHSEERGCPKELWEEGARRVTPLLILASSKVPS